MTITSVLVCETQVPFVRGGAEILVRQLVGRLRARGLVADRVSVPFTWTPPEEILAHAAAWRLLDLTQSNGRPVDAVIATKFPTYFVRHPNKIAWLVHQHRAAYELCGTAYSAFGHNEADVGLRDRLIRLDREMLGECTRRYAIAKTVSARLDRYNGLHAEALYHPPTLADRLAPGPYGDYFLSVSRLESVKRVDLAVRALAHVDPPMRLVVAGDGTHRDQVERAAEEAGVADRTTFLGIVDDETVIDLYAGARGVVFPPYDEDYGYVTLEAFLCRKPVVTTVDSGGPLEFVEHEVNGFVCEPEPAALGEAMQRLAASATLAASLGDAGYARASGVTWDGVIETLLGV